MKKPSISTIIIFLIILLAVLGLIMLKTPKEINAPTDNLDQNATTTATTTASNPQNTDTVPVTTSTNTQSPTVPQKQVIQGEGFIAEITPVANGEVILPEIKSFTLDRNENGVCRFSWDVSKAETCNFVNLTTSMQVKSAGDEGGIQTTDKGDFQLKCYGKNGGSIKSEVISCK